MPAFPYLERPLADSSVIVRLAAERDIPEVLIAHQDDPQMYAHTGLERPPSGAELGRRSERAEFDRTAGRALALTILETGSDTCRGQVDVHHVDWDNARAELGIWVAPQWRARGLARGALALVAPWLLRECRLERVQLLTEADNERMIRSARAAGFTHEGVLRGYARDRQRRRGRRPARVDYAILSLVRRDLTG